MCSNQRPPLFSFQVSVSVLDENDSPPSFRAMPTRYRVSEDHQAGRRIAVISATDPDTIGDLSYSLISGDDDKFELDSASGQLSLKESVDRETKDVYELVVRAKNGHLFTDTAIYIEVRLL